MGNFLVFRFFTMSSKFVLIFGLFILDQFRSAIPHKECTILNEYYNEYLFAENTQYSSYSVKEIYTTKMPEEKIFKALAGDKKYTYANEINGKRFAWKIEPTNGQLDTFYVKNSNYDEHFQAARFSDSIFGQRRSVTVRVMHSEQDSSFMWRFERKNRTQFAAAAATTDSNGIADGVYFIWNVKHKEALYAGNYFFKKSHSKRRVFTWHAYPENGKKFFWTVKCFRKDKSDFS